jgi:hypothetical protein
MFALMPFVLTAALGSLAGLTAVRWWADALRRSQGYDGDAERGGDEPEAQWLIYCPTCRVHLAAATARRCGQDGCAFPG